MKIACVGYREWALNIYKNIASSCNEKFLILNSKNEYKEEIIFNFKPDIILFYGWSWHISKKIINEFKCLMLHPSPLPKYRGGSPIQNQIINGELESKVSIFLMTEELDAGPILLQESFSLEGNMKNIFKRIEKIGIKLTKKILEEFPVVYEQNHTEATYFKRRKIESSQITLDEIYNKDALYLFNKIRMLSDPYPNAYIKTKDGKYLLIKEVELHDEYPYS
tara:strand:+ start:503 stop:1168 length:666 start_codon:yes stop_codon:yes gene_type:complete